MGTPFIDKQKNVSRFREPCEPRGYTKGKLVDFGSPSPKMEEKFRAELERTERDFNEAFIKQPQVLSDILGMRVPASLIRLSTKRIREDQNIFDRSLRVYQRMFPEQEAKDHDAVKSGFLHTSQIRSIVQTFYRLTVDGRSIAVKGAAQSGKTSYIDGLTYMGPFMFMHTYSEGHSEPLIYAPLLLCPNINDLEDEMLASLRNFFALYANVDIIGPNPAQPPVRISTYFDLPYLWDAIGGKALTHGVFESMVLGRNAEASMEDFFLSQDRKAPCHVAKRERGSMKGALAYIQNCINRGFEPLIGMDEMQWGMLKGGVTDNFMLENVRYKGVTRSIRDICCDKDTNMRAILPSATIFALWGKTANVQRQYLFLGPNYHGLNFDDGKTIDPSVKNTETTILDFSGIEKMMRASAEIGEKANGFQDIIGSRPSSTTAYKNAEPNSVYRKKYHELVAAWVNYVTDPRHSVGGNSACDDAVMRLINNNDKTLEIAAAIRPLVNAVVVTWVGNGKESRRRFAQLVKAGRVPGKPLVVIVSGRARMGTVVLESFRHGLDTARPKLQVTVDQGLLARLSGHGKGPTNYFYCPDDEAVRINCYIRAKGDRRKARALQQGVVVLGEGVTQRGAQRETNHLVVRQPDVLEDITRTCLAKLDHSKDIDQLCTHGRSGYFPVLDSLGKHGLNGAAARGRFDCRGNAEKVTFSYHNKGGTSVEYIALGWTIDDPVIRRFVAYHDRVASARLDHSMALKGNRERSTGSVELDRFAEKLQYLPLLKSLRAGERLPLPGGGYEVADFGGFPTMTEYIRSKPDLCRSLCGTDSIDIFGADDEAGGWFGYNQHEEDNGYVLTSYRYYRDGDAQNRMINRERDGRRWAEPMIKMARVDGDKEPFTVRFAQKSDGKKRAPGTMLQEDLKYGHRWRVHEIVLPIRISHSQQRAEPPTLKAMLQRKDGAEICFGFIRVDGAGNKVGGEFAPDDGNSWKLEEIYLLAEDAPDTSVPDLHAPGTAMRVYYEKETI
jgi:hypothetical protein